MNQITITDMALLGTIIYEKFSLKLDQRYK